MGLNDAAWERLFEKYSILDVIEREGKFIIQAAQIKEFREPRLMTKFDHRVNLPEIFTRNNLSILPVNRSEYMISSFAAYKDLETPAGEPERVRVPAHRQTLSPRFLVSETIALNCAHACGILNDFLEDEQLVATVNGRMGSGDFDFCIDTRRGEQTVSVRGAQIEIDAAYEGVNYLTLIEAKRDLADDFLVRQLYYPYRVWSSRVTKPVKLVFLVYSNGVFTLHEYRFEDPMRYNSLRLVKQKRYAISTGISERDLHTVVHNVHIEKEPSIAFPQANSMARIVNLMELLHERPMTGQQITDEYAFDARQTSYYTAAGRYLGLMERGTDEEGAACFRLSELGRGIMELGHKERQMALASAILRHGAFNETLKRRLHTGKMPDTEEIVAIMQDANLYKVESMSTYRRRSSTVSGWIHWILNLVDENE